MNDQKVQDFFKDIPNITALVVGDVMVDAYLFGSVNRISPEAPVPIFDVKNRENRLGGAANVALNLKALGAKTLLAGVIGEDTKGNIFLDLLKEQQIGYEGIVRLKNRPTISKTRIIAGSHHILRVDEEDKQIINEAAQALFMEKINDLFHKNSVDVVIFEDYDKGLLNANLIELITEIALSHGSKICVDPRKSRIRAYPNTHLFKPNFKEFVEGIKVEIDKSDFVLLEKELNAFAQKQNIQNILLTLSELGVLLLNTNETLHLPAQLRNIADVSGAGDTVISVAALALTFGLSNKQIAFLANLAGGLVCEEVGVVPINLEKLKNEYFKLAN